MTYEEFINQRTNQPVDFDGVYPNQCMDLMHQYVYDVLGITDKTVLAAPAAYQVFQNFPSGGTQQFDRIDNTPDGVPQKGDIVFFGTAIGPYGHVCIFIEGDTNTFRSFDANWPTGSLPHIQDHNYTGVLGWLRPKPQVQMATISQAELDQIRSDRDHNWQLYQAAQTTIADLQAKLAAVPKPTPPVIDPAADATIMNLKAQIESQTTKATTYLQALQQIKAIVYGKWIIREPIKTVLSKVGA